jgi:hypothetical protein
MVAIILVCHGGELELKAAFLIYSLRKNLRGNYNIYIGIPSANRFISEPSPMFISFCIKNKVEIYNFENTYLKNSETIKEGDLVSNKIFACCRSFEEEHIVFLDTDIVLLQNLDVKSLVSGTVSIKLKPANRANITQWTKIYHIVDLQMPVQRVVSSIDKLAMPPYFNSGVIVMNSQFSKKLIEDWQKYFYMLSEEKIYRPIKYPFFHRDQISLSLAICSCRMEYSILDEKFNYPVRGKKINKNSPPYLVHYHNAYSVYFERQLRKEFLEFKKQYPDFLEEAKSIWKDLFAENFVIRTRVAFSEYIRFKKYKALQYFRTIAKRVFIRYI